MFRTFLIAALLAAPAATVSAGEKAAPPLGPPPRVMILHVEREGAQYLLQTVAETVPVQRMELVKVGDKVQQRVVTVHVQVSKQVRIGLDGKDVQVFGSDGKRIAARDVPRFLKAVPILVSADGKPVDPIYLRLVREGTLIVVAPALVVRPGMPIGVPPIAVPLEKIPVPKG